MKKIAFIGRKQGLRSWRYEINGLERDRLNEQKALSETSGLAVVDDPTTADLIQIRLNPEQTSRRTLRKIAARLKDLPAQCRVLNNPQTFDLVAEKHLSYSAWEKAGLKTINYDLWSFWLPRAEQLTKIRAFLNGRGGYLRTHNEDSGKGIFYLSGNESDQQLQKIISKLRFRALTSRVSGSQALITAEVNNRVNGVGEVFRVHMVNGKVLGGYGLVGRGKIIHSRDVNRQDMDAFIAANTRLIQWFNDEKWKSLWLQAMAAVGLDFGALEFFCVDGEPVFLEVNPMWGGHHRFGDEDLTYWLRNGAPESMRQQVPNVFAWLDSKGFYQRYWQSLANL